MLTGDVNGFFTTMRIENAGEKRIEAPLTNSQNQSAYEVGNTVYLVGFEGDCVFQGPFAKSGVGFRQVLF